MSGHSKWANIKHKKEAADKVKGKAFSRIAKEIMVAAKMGGADPDANPRLRSALTSAKAVNMPNANIERAIKKGVGELGDAVFEEIVYEGYAPGGVAVMVECLTDNKNRSISDVRMVFDRNNGNMAGDKDFDEAQAWENAWQAMDKFIEQDAYLSKHRGEYTKRNGAVAPFANQLDLSISHDIIVPQRNGREHKLRFSFNIDNFLNLLNRNWGVSYSQYLGTNGQQYQFLSVTQKPTAANDYTLQYKMTNGLKDIYGNDISLDRTYKPDIGSYWTMQFGIKYMF